MKKSKKAEQSIFAEAWQNMSADMAKVLPKKLCPGKGSWKIALLLALIELVILGATGTWIYSWLAG